MPLVDKQASADWLQKSAEAGDVLAMYHLGTMYHKGDGIPVNQQAAARWLQKSAKNGYALAMYNIGVMYAKGDGVQQDDSLAKQWFRKAMEAGDDKVKKDARLALAWLQ